MAGISLNKALSADFLQRFVGLASSSQSPTQAVKGGLQGDKALSAGLRIGARTFATAVDGLNGAISFVNLSQKTLEDLSKITDKLIDVTKRATSIQTSADSRAKLEIEFKRLAGEFRRTVKNATTGDNEFLSKEGLTEVFQTIGLDEKSSSSIARIFSQFVTSSSDDSLASEKTAGPQITVPIGAFSVRESDSEYTIERISNIEYSGGGISSVNSVILGDVSTTLNQNAGYQSIATVDTNGSVTAIREGALSQSILRVLDVQESTGYSLIVSRDDLLGGYNPDLVEQIFLVDNQGVVLTQFTENTLPGTSYTSGQLSQSSLSIAYSLDSEENAKPEVYLATIGGYLETPTSTLIATGDVGAFTSVRMDNEGTYVAYRDEANSSIALYSVSDMTTDDSISGLGNITDFGFISGGTLAYLDPSDRTTVIKVAYGTGVTEEFGTVEAPADVFTIVQDVGFAAYSSADNYVRVFDSTASNVRTIEMRASDQVQEIFLAQNQSDPTNIDIGIAGDLTTLGYSGTNFLYRIADNPAFTTPQARSRVTPALYDPITYDQRNSIFDDSKKLTNRAQAYRTLNDLESLKDQIDKNIGALNSARKTLSDNIKLVRAAGNAFLEISEQVTSADDAQSLARKLQTKIRSAGSAALSQAENLNALTVAALTNSGEG